jgi:hypothetical protein
VYPQWLLFSRRNHWAWYSKRELVKLCVVAEKKGVIKSVVAEEAELYRNECSEIGKHRKIDARN